MSKKRGKFTKYVPGILVVLHLIIITPIMPSQDAFYALPDSLLSLILSKLPIRDAVQTSLLSKRWRFLYNHMPTLTFSMNALWS